MTDQDAHTHANTHTHQDVNVITLQRARQLSYGWLATTKWMIGRSIWQNWVKKYSPSIFCNVKFHTGCEQSFRFAHLLFSDESVVFFKLYSWSLWDILEVKLHVSSQSCQAKRIRRMRRLRKVWFLQQTGMVTPVWQTFPRHPLSC